MIRVVTHRDNATTSRWVRSAGERHPSVAVADLLDHTDKSSIAFADAVLEGMGKLDGLFNVKRRSEPLTAAWVRNSLPLTVVVPDAQLLDPGQVTQCASWLDGHGADVWLCCATRSPQHPNDATARMGRYIVHATDAEVATESEFREQIGSLPRRARRSPAEATKWPRVPRVDGIVFRSSCASLLAGPDRDRVDREFVRNVAVAFESIADRSSTGVRARVFWPMIRDAIDAAEDAEHLIIIVRAMQVAFCLRGWHLRVETPMLLGAAHSEPRLGEFDSLGLWDRFEVYRDPDPGAVASMYLAGADAEFIRNLTVGDVTEAPTPAKPLTFNTASGRIDIENAGVRYVRTLATYRRLSGAGDADSLFDTHRGDGISHQQLTRLLNLPATEIGVAPSRGRVTAAQSTAEQTAKRYGLTLRSVAQGGARNRT